MKIDDLEVLTYTDAYPNQIVIKHHNSEMRINQYELNDLRYALKCASRKIKDEVKG